MNRRPRKVLVVIDPGVHTPEIDSLNLISTLSSIPCTYHLPAMYGFGTLSHSYVDMAGIIILGSAASVHDNLSWQRELESFVAGAIEQEVPVLGCCYGLQMLAYMFKGQVGFVLESREKLKGVRTVSMRKNALFDAGDHDVIVTHAEMVTRVPDDFSIIATSNIVTVEGIAHKRKPVYGFQFHPEATQQFLRGHEMKNEKTISALGAGHKIIQQFVHMAEGLDNFK